MSDYYLNRSLSRDERFRAELALAHADKRAGRQPRYSPGLPVTDPFVRGYVSQVGRGWHGPVWHHP